MTSCCTEVCNEYDEDTKSGRKSECKTFRIITIALAVSFGLIAAETVLRIKNMSMKNYDIEMWRYGKELQKASTNPILGHEHLANSSAMLEGVEIKLNNRGMRGNPIEPRVPGKRRILFLGSSITLGWGVRAEDVFTIKLQNMFKQDNVDVDVLNAGIGNYNTERYVELFLSQLKDLQPTDVAIHYFINDAELLTPSNRNPILHHSQLAFTAWTMASQKTAPNESQEDHYRKLYASDSPGFLKMKEALTRLGKYASENDIRLHLMIVPDTHNLTEYPYNDIHQKITALATELGYNVIDLYPGFKGLTHDDIWVLPCDPHPNALGHRIMAETIYRHWKEKPVLAIAG